MVHLPLHEYGDIVTLHKNVLACTCSWASTITLTFVKLNYVTEYPIQKQQTSW